MCEGGGGGREGEGEGEGRGIVCSKLHHRVRSSPSAPQRRHVQVRLSTLFLISFRLVTQSVSQHPPTPSQHSTDSHSHESRSLPHSLPLRLALTDDPKPLIGVLPDNFNIPTGTED